MTKPKKTSSKRGVGRVEKRKVFVEIDKYGEVVMIYSNPFSAIYDKNWERDYVPATLTYQLPLTKKR